METDANLLGGKFKGRKETYIFRIFVSSYAVFYILLPVITKI
jgi:hypothetical protein